MTKIASLLHCTAGRGLWLLVATSTTSSWHTPAAALSTAFVIFLALLQV
jgi:hypothetical protein